MDGYDRKEKADQIRDWFLIRNMFHRHNELTRNLEMVDENLDRKAKEYEERYGEEFDLRKKPRLR